MKANHGFDLLIRLMATAWLFLFVAGCGRSPVSPSLYIGGPSGVISWAPPAGTDHPVPGIDYGTVYHVGTAFVVWSDAPGGGGGSTSSSEEGVKGQGSLLARDGRRVELHCDTKDGKTGPVGVNGIGYDLADGNLFLVRTDGDHCRVKQLRRDVSQWTFEPDNLRAIGPSESAIAQFFNSPVQPK
jgi:hypothetical protein